MWNPAKLFEGHPSTLVSRGSFWFLPCAIKNQELQQQQRQKKCLGCYFSSSQYCENGFGGILRCNHLIANLQSKGNSSLITGRFACHFTRPFVLDAFTTSLEVDQETQHKLAFVSKNVLLCITYTCGWLKQTKKDHYSLSCCPLFNLEIRQEWPHRPRLPPGRWVLLSLSCLLSFFFFPYPSMFHTAQACRCQ